MRETSSPKKVHEPKRKKQYVKRTRRKRGRKEPTRMWHQEALTAEPQGRTGVQRPQRETGPAI